MNAITIPDTLTTPCTHECIELANAVICPHTGRQMEYRDLISTPATKSTWTKSFSNELGRLAQGDGDHINGTDTIFFIPRTKVPQNKKPTYARIVCDIRPQKQEPERTRLTVGGNMIDYPGPVSTASADLTTAKVLFNSTISTNNARFMCIDIKNYYLGTPMDQYEYMKLHISLIPDNIIKLYNLMTIVDEQGYIYIEIRKGMYGLPQAGRLAFDLLKKRLSAHGYAPVQHTPGLWKHNQLPIAFTLVVDDFGVKYINKHHAIHLITTLQNYYTISEDWTGSTYCGIHLDWDYAKRQVTLSMPGYVQAALHLFQHPQPNKAMHAPSTYNRPIYGATIQYALTDDETPPLNKQQVKRLQEVVGKFLFYGRAVDPTMLHALNSLATQQTTGNQSTLAAMNTFLDYASTHPDATITYQASDMILHIHSDASYLSEKKARSRVGGHHILTNRDIPPPNNGPIFNVASILKHVMGSAAEAEVGGCYVNAREALPIRELLKELGHPQPPTPIQTDNSTASGILNDTVKQKRSKAMDMRYYWLKDRVEQQQFNIYWAPGITNPADYFTKHHAPKHHMNMRQLILNIQQINDQLRGCVKNAKSLQPVNHKIATVK